MVDNALTKERAILRATSANAMPRKRNELFAFARKAMLIEFEKLRQRCSYVATL